MDLIFHVTEKISMLLYSRLYCFNVRQSTSYQTKVLKEIVLKPKSVINILLFYDLQNRFWPQSGVCFNGFLEAQIVKLDRGLEVFQTFGGCKRDLQE